MSFAAFGLRNICSWALKAQIPRNHLKPIHFARLSSNAPIGSEQVKVTHITDDNEESFKDSDHEFQSSASFEKCINEVNLLGRIVSGPTSHTDVQVPFVTFKLETKRMFGSKENDMEMKEHRENHLIRTNHMKKMERVLANLKTGQRVYVNGKLTYRRTAKGDLITLIILDDFVTL